MKQTYITLGIVLLALIVAIAVYGIHGTQSPAATTPTGAPVAYACDTGKTFTATFASSTVALVLSDGRALTLPQVVSGSGIRYEQGGVSFIGKGSDAFIDENGTQTYTNCIVNAGGETSTTTTTSGSSGTKVFTDQGNTFSFSYPTDFTASGAGIGYTQSWMNNATTTGLVLAKLTLPKSFQPRTNFSEATLTVGTSADASAVASCLSDTTGLGTSKSTVTINGTTFTKFVEGDAGAGNRYDTTSYHTKRNSQCYVVEYTIHSTNIGNYSPDQGISEFDHAKVNSLLDGVIQSFTFN